MDLNPISTAQSPGEAARLPNVHPGEVLREEFLVPLGISPFQLARKAGVSLTTLQGILSGQQGMPLEFARRLAGFFGTSVLVWRNLQAAYDQEEEDRKPPGAAP